MSHYQRSNPPHNIVFSLRCAANDILRHNHIKSQPIDTGEAKKKKKKKKAKKKKKVEQGDPPRTGLSKVYPDGKFPVGEIQEYKNE